MEKILDGNDYAQSLGKPSLRELLKSAKYERFDTPYKDVEPTGKPVFAFVSFGFWVASCECNGAEYVADGQPFYCMSCGNYEYGGIPRPVIFPENRAEIEAELLRRPITMSTGRNAWERAQRARAATQTPAGWLSRTWLAGETVKDLKTQNAILGKRRRR